MPSQNDVVVSLIYEQMFRASGVFTALKDQMKSCNTFHRSREASHQFLLEIRDSNAFSWKPSQGRAMRLEISDTLPFCLLLVLLVVNVLWFHVTFMPSNANLLLTFCSFKPPDIVAIVRGDRYDQYYCDIDTPIFLQYLKRSLLE